MDPPPRPDVEPSGEIGYIPPMPTVRVESGIYWNLVALARARQADDPSVTVQGLVREALLGALARAKAPRGRVARRKAARRGRPPLPVSSPR
jgi:hypothetical protein